MKSKGRMAATAFVVAVLLCGMDVGAARADFVPGELIVVFNEEVLPALTFGEGVESEYEGLGELFTTYELTDALALFSDGCPLQNVYLLQFPEEADLDAITEDLENLTFVVSVDKNYIRQVCSTPNDYYFSHDINGSGELDQWTFYKMQLNRAWDVTRGDSTQIVAVIDTGFDWHHPDLDQGVAWINTDEDINHSGAFENVSSGSGGDLNGVDDDHDGGPTDDVIGFDFLGVDPDPAPDPHEMGDHGTNMSSIIRAETNNGLGVAGVTWFTKIMPLRAGAGENLVDTHIVSAINYAVKNGAKVVNMSFAGGTPNTSIHRAIQKGDSLGVIFVAGAGGANSEAPTYPGAYDEVIRVTSVDSLGYKTMNANYGTTVDISAPTSQDSYNEDGIATCRYFDGASNVYPGDSSPHVFRFTQLATSGASAEVAGIVALLRAAYPDSSNAFIKHELYRGAMPLQDALYGYGKLGAGVVNAYRSLTRWGTVTSDTTWGSASHPTTVYISGDITVAVGATLTIEPGTTIKIARQDNEHLGADDDLVEINVEGELVADGTAAHPIIFDSWVPTTTSDWLGIYFDSGSDGGTFDHCTIRRAECGIETYVSVTVTNTTIDTCVVGLLVRHGNSLVQNSVVQAIDDRGVVVEGDITTVRNTTVAGVGTTALDVRYASTVVLRNSTFSNADEGMYVQGTAYTTTADIDSSCTFGANDIGISCYAAGGYVTVKQSFFDACATGMYCDGGSSPMIDTNMFDNCDVAIYCNASSSPTIKNNNIQHFDNGIVVASSSNPDIGHYSSTGNNRIAYQNTGGKYIYNYTATTLYAQNNCWNLATGGCSPSSSRFTGPSDRSNPICCSFSEFMVYQIPDKPASTPQSVSKKTQLTGIVPNPFNPITTVHYDLSARGKVHLNVYDVSGTLVRVLVNEIKPAGSHEIVWDGRDQRGSQTASGVYFVRLTSGREVSTKKMVLLK
jgi:parallel beta-helix repeat protein